jgi:acetyl-CoA synthetase
MTRDRYRELYRGFRWHVPAEFNIAEVCARRWAAETSRVAIRTEAADGQPIAYTYAALLADANRLANALAALGVGRGDRVAIVLAQRAETAVSHLAIYQLGAIAMPLSVLFGADALAYRLANSEAVAAICDGATAHALAGLRAQCPQLRHNVAIDVDGDGLLPWQSLLERATASIRCARAPPTPRC